MDHPDERERNAAVEVRAQELLFARKLRTALKDKEIAPARYAEVEDACGFGPGTIRMMIGGNCFPDQSSVQRLANYLHIKPEDLWIG